MRKIEEIIAEQHPRCPVCSARGRIEQWDRTCDGICHRAYVKGITRGLQIELETRRDKKRPYPEPEIPAEELDAFEGEERIGYEMEIFYSDLFDNAERVRV
jgi:hypothetical protein